MEARRETWETREHTARGDNIPVTKNRRKKDNIHTRGDMGKVDTPGEHR